MAFVFQPYQTTSKWYLLFNEWMALNNGCTCVLFSLAFCSFVLSIIVKTVYTHTHTYPCSHQPDSETECETQSSWKIHICKVIIIITQDLKGAVFVTLYVLYMKREVFGSVNISSPDIMYPGVVASRDIDIQRRHTSSHLNLSQSNHYPFKLELHFVNKPATGMRDEHCARTFTNCKCWDELVIASIPASVDVSMNVNKWTFRHETWCVYISVFKEAHHFLVVVLVSLEQSS